MSRGNVFFRTLCLGGIRRLRNGRNDTLHVISIRAHDMDSLRPAQRSRHAIVLFKLDGARVPAVAL